ncbi:uncharacterized protein LOC142230803 [Haematobia irritans]|uniref:uncharacterized protein LOC142230803 n=1 Tax=Haematobia irritans TaxID=7368 RepID=UPI003F506C1C
MLLKGPDLVTPLLTVLHGFRIGKIAISGDIKEMFHQVLIRKEDQGAQRFFWRNAENRNPDIYVMQVMTFGAACSPSSAQYVKNTNAMDFSVHFPRAVDSILNHNYVDDLLDSASNESEAISLAKEVSFIHGEGGFFIRNWKSNSKFVLENLGELEEKNHYVPIANSMIEMTIEKVLGMWWSTSDDCFTYNLQMNRVNQAILTGIKRPTKRDMLRTLMSIFDPLGFLSAYVVFLKILLQEVWRTTDGWTDEVNDVVYNKWRRWLESLPDIENVKIPRWHSITPQSSVQLHVFVDASEQAYAAVAYYRVITQNKVTVSLVSAKVKVAPKQPLSIPRLELMAAVLGVRLANSICDVPNMKLEMRCFWSDSLTVLSWLNADPKKYKQFVMHRIGEVLENSKPFEWRYIPTKNNVADDATKWSNNYKFDMKHRCEEYAILQQCGKIHKSSVLYKCSPFLDENLVIRLGGRIDLAPIASENAKRPVILPRSNYCTQLIIKHFHTKYHHIHHETCLNELRQRFYIPRLRVELKKVRRECQHCKNQNALPVVPEMSSLPRARLSAFTRPFSFVGVDYFGPFYVKVGRHQEKRWGVIFTCLTIRAIHIEVAHTMTTDSCIMVIQNFTARRGIPIEIYCDNGTNLKGAEKELRNALKHVDHENIADKFTTSSTSWHFNPPASPHMGGSWERLIKSVKKILHQILPHFVFKDETLYNGLLECERVINSRPLTYVDLEQSSDEALTPNHFLLGSSDGCKPLGKFSHDDSLLRKNWRKMQYFADMFWKKWVNEYLPTITRRTKWFEKCKPLEINDVVIVVDANLPRNSWPKGIVQTVYKSKDGNIRSAEVVTEGGIIHRPVAKLAKLDVKRSAPIG